MARSSRPDPVHETILAILRQLNQAEFRHEGQVKEQSLELEEIEDRVARAQAGGRPPTSIALALGLLLRNGLVKGGGSGGYSWQRQRATRQRYQITPAGKKFLLEAIETSDRVR